jgi:hypothetical protein
MFAKGDQFEQLKSAECYYVHDSRSWPMGISEFPLAHCMNVLFPAPVTPMTVMKAHGAPSTVSGLKSLFMIAANF